MYDYTLQQLVLRLAVILLLVGLHGGALAATALLLGDKGVRHDGRATASPLAHLDLLGLLAALFFSVGWVKPVAIDPRSLRGGRAALLLPILAAFAADLLLLPLLLLARQFLLPHLPDSAAETLFALVTVAGPLSIGFALANLLPLPPYSGALLLQALRPALAGPIRRLHLAAGLVMLALAWFGVIGSVLGGPETLLAGLLLRQ